MWLFRGYGTRRDKKTPATRHHFCFHLICKKTQTRNFLDHFLTRIKYFLWFIWHPKDLKSSSSTLETCNQGGLVSPPICTALTGSAWISGVWVRGALLTVSLSAYFQIQNLKQVSSAVRDIYIAVFSSKNKLESGQFNTLLIQVTTCVLKINTKNTSIQPRRS